MLLFALLLSVAAYPLLFGRFYAIGDMYDVFLPLEHFFRQELLAGRLPSWHPDIAWGFPVIASAQIGFFYPLLLVLRLLPPAVYLPLVLFLHLFALAVGTYLFARERIISHHGALFGAMSMTLSAFVWQHITHLNIMLIVAWLPWQLLAMNRLAASPRPRLRERVSAAAAVAAPFLVGHLHLPFLMAVVSIIYYFTHQRQPWWRGLRTVVLVTILAVSLAAVQILPTLELVQYSSRGAGGDFSLERANQLSLPLYHLPTVIFPRFFGTDSTYWGKRLEVEYGIFIGTLPWLLAAVTLRSGWKKQRFFIIAAAVSVLLALGDLSPFRLLGLEPSLWYFSAPARWLLVYTFATSILAGAGFDIVQADARRLRRGSFWLLVILATVVALYNPMVWNLPASTPVWLTERLGTWNALGAREPAYYEEKFASLIVSLQHSGVSITSFFTWLPLSALAAGSAFALARRAPYVVLALTAAELLLVAATTTPTLPWATILTPPQTVAALPASVQQRQARVVSLPDEGDTGLFLTNPGSRDDAVGRELRRQLLVPASHARFSIPGSQWPASLDLQVHSEAWENLTREELNIGAVLTSSAEENGVEIHELKPQPRAALVTPDGTVALQYAATVPTELRWTVTAPGDAQLIVRDTFYAGWQATMDGRRVPLKPYESIFRQVAVPRGEHAVTMAYWPRALYAGLAISLTAAGGMAVILWFDRRYRPLSAGR